jgi:hypothetical protein
MTKSMTRTLFAAAAFIAATPAVSGPAETAVSLCKAEFVQQLGTASGTPFLTVRSIREGAKETRVRIVATTDTRHVIECRVDYQGRILIAALDRPADGSEKVQRADSPIRSAAPRWATGARRGSRGSCRRQGR